MKCVEIRRFQYGGCSIVRLEELPSFIGTEFDDAEVGSTLILTLDEMSEEEYHQLPEFTGW